VRCEFLRDYLANSLVGGKGLYEKFGCKTVKVLEFDLKEFGVDGKMVMDSMLKKAGN